jgi:hypothetical protein
LSQKKEFEEFKELQEFKERSLERTVCSQFSDLLADTAANLLGMRLQPGPS